MKAPIIGALALLLATTALAGNDEQVREPAGNPVWKSKSQFKETQRGWDDIIAGNLESATRRFEKVMDRTSSRYEWSQAVFGLAQVAIIDKDLDRAIELYEKTVQYDRLPNKPHFETILQLAELETLQGRPDQATTWLDRWRRENVDPAPEDVARADRLEARINGEEVESGAATQDPMPLVRVVPRYPRQAAIRNIEGQVTIKATVAEDGSVQRAEIVAAEPEGVFDDAALAAIERWQFETSDRAKTVTQVFDFTVND
ncbi:MAG: TonB family protein [Pseudomonadota bacterium]